MHVYSYLNQRIPIEQDFCFVIMPFDDNLSAIFHRGIKPVVEEFNFRCIRADQHIESAPILFEIFDDILRARVVIADLTDANPNVFYELGICHAMKKDVILIKRKGSPVPFNIGGFRHIEYEDRPGGEELLQEALRVALALKKDMGEDGLFDVHAMTRNLKKGCHLWNSGGEIVIGFEEFMEIVLGLDHLNPTDDEVAFLCRAAAYFGKFMRRMSEVAHGNKLAVRALVVEAATGTFTRVPWRAAAMLEHFDRHLVEIEVDKLDKAVVNEHIFPAAVLQRSTFQLLGRAVNDLQSPKETREKLADVLRQVRSEFGTR